MTMQLDRQPPAPTSTADPPRGTPGDRLNSTLPWLLFALAIGVFVGVGGSEILDGIAKHAALDLAKGSAILAIGLPVLIFAIVIMRQRAIAMGELRRAEARLRDMAEAASDWLWEMGPDLRFTFFSGQVPGLDPSRPDTIIGRTRFEVGDQTLDPGAWARHAEDLAQRRPFRDFVYRQPLQDGTMRWRKVSGRPFYGPDGGFLGYRGTASDVTAQKDAEIALARALDDARQSEAKFRSLVANIPGAIYRLSADADRKLVYVSGPIEAITGRSAASHMAGGRPAWFGMIHPDDHEHARRVIDRSIASQTPFALEYRIVRRDGSVHWVFDRGQIFASPDGRGSYCDGVMFDITDRKMAEADLRAAKDQAESASRAKSDFLAIMSHELRTPLNAIIGFSEMLENEALGPIGNARYLDYAEDIRVSGKHLLSLINDILDLSKAEAGAMELNEEEVDLGAIVESCIVMVRPRTDQAQISVSVELAPDLPVVRADERKLRQAILNLLSNSVKYSSVGGEIRITAAATHDGLRLSIADTGIGIAAGDIPKALSLFGQIDSPLNRRNTGTGLGLPLAKRIVEVHGGRFEMDSEFGKGTTVTLEMPAHRLVAAPP